MSVLETEQDTVVVGASPPIMSSACLLPVESFSQQVSLIREMRYAKKKKGKQSKETKQ